MEYPSLKLEEYLLKWKSKTKYFLNTSDMEPLKQSELITLADSQLQGLWDNLVLGYTGKEGTQILTDEIHKIYDHPHIFYDNIACFTGAKEAIFCSLNYLINQGDEVITIIPGYPYIETLAKFLGAKITNVTLKDKDGWNFDIKELKTKVTNNTKLIVLNFPHNPTGLTLNDDIISKIIQIARKYGILILSIEVYRFLEHDQNYITSSLSYIYENSLSIGSIGKTLGLSGTRISWAVSQNKSLLKKIEQIRHFTSVCNSSSSEILAAIALRNKNFLIKRNIKLIQYNLSVLEEFIKKYYFLFSWNKPNTGCVGLIKYLEKKDVLLFSEDLVIKRGVLIVPSLYFNLNKNYFRIGFGRESFLKGLEEFSLYVEKHL